MKEAKFRCSKTINTENYGIFSISWSPNGNTIATALDNGILEIWSVE